MAAIPNLSALARQAVQTTNLDSLVARFTRTFHGPNSEAFSPGDPIIPVAPDEQPKRQQYQIGGNLVYTPRSGFTTTFELLRFFATQYSIAAICINTRIETLAGMEWKFIPRDHAAQKSKKFQKDIDRVTEFWRNPDKQNGWSGWLRMALRDRLEIDALTLYPRRNKGGGLHSVEVLDGATMKVLVDHRGRVPDPPAPAYQQVLWGIPRSLWTSEQIMYCPQNIQSYSVYGRAEVETILIIVNTALRKQTMDLSHFTESNIPRALVSTPADWTPSQIEEFQTFWDEFLSGDLSKRSRMILAPGSGSQGRVGVYEFSQFSGDTNFDTWLLKITCAALQTTPAEIGFTDDVNKATSEAQERVQSRGGTNPLAQFISDKIDRINREYLDAEHLKHEWETGEEEDEAVEAQVHSLYLNTSVLQPDEVREKMGLEPYGLPPYVLIGGKPVLVEDFVTYAKGNVQEELLIASSGPQAPGGVASASLQSGAQAPSSAQVDESGQPVVADPSGDEERHPSLPSTSPSTYTQKSDEPVVELVVEPPVPIVVPSFDAHAARDDLRRWRTKVLKAVEAGRSVPGFQTDVVPDPVKEAVAQELLEMSTVAGPERPRFVRKVFEAALVGLEPLPTPALPVPDEVVVDLLALEQEALAKANGWDSWNDAWTPDQ